MPFLGEKPYCVCTYPYVFVFSTAGDNYLRIMAAFPSVPWELILIGEVKFSRPLIGRVGDEQ